LLSLIDDGDDEDASDDDIVALAGSLDRQANSDDQPVLSALVEQLDADQESDSSRDSDDANKNPKVLYTEVSADDLDISEIVVTDPVEPSERPVSVTEDGEAGRAPLADRH